MINLYVFLNTRVENSGTLAWIGDKGLAPFRYLFNGKTIRIELRDSDHEIEIHHVASFHKSGDWNYSKTTRGFNSSSTGMIKTAVSVVLLAPSLLLAVFFKGIAYLFSRVREKHHLVKEHLTPINREIGSTSNPIKTIEALRHALNIERTSDPKNHPTNALIIHGDGALTINEDPGILDFNPKKLILDGAQIVHQPSPTDRLDDAMVRSGKWKPSTFRLVTGNPDNPGAILNRVNSIEEALQATAPRRSWTSCKRYHMIFNLARPNVV